MRSYKFQFLLLLLFVMVGCQQDEMTSSMKKGSYSLAASIENNDSTSRTAVDENGGVTWVETDAIGVFGTKTKNAKFESTGAGANVTFAGELESSNEEPTLAYYPYNENASLDGNSLSFTLPSEYTYTGESNAPMLGVKQADGTFSFKHLCGLLKVTVKNMPENAKRLFVVSEGTDEKEAPFLTGDVTVNDVTTNNATLSITKNGSREVSIDLKNVSAQETYAFYIPVPVGEYPMLSVKLEANNGLVYFEKNISEIEIERSMLLNMPMIDVERIQISPNYVEIDWEKTLIKDIDLDKNSFTLDFKGNIPHFREGSYIVIDADTIGYLRRVKSIQSNGNLVTFMTENASMSDIFLNSSFILATNLTTNIHNPSNKTIVYPQEIWVKDKDSDWTSILQTRGSVDIELIKNGIDYSGTTLYKSDTQYLYLPEFKANWGLTGILDFNFESIVEAYDVIKEKNVELTGSLVGKFDVSCKIRYEAKGKYSRDDGRTLMKKNVKQFTIKTSVANVPIIYTVSLDLFNYLKIEAEGDFFAEGGFYDEIEGEVGVRYSQRNGELDPFTNMKHNYGPYLPEFGGYAEAEWKLSLFPRVNIAIYGVTGPSFDIIPYNRNRILSGFYDKLGSNVNDYYASQMKHYVGLDFAAGVNTFPLVGEKDTELMTNPFNIFDMMIFQTPYDIKSENDDLLEFIDGKVYEQKFYVKDLWHTINFDNIQPSSFSHTVKFGPEDEVDKVFAVCDENNGGVVSVKWKPMTSRSVLTAALFAPTKIGEPLDTLAKAEVKFMVIETGDAKNIDINSAEVSGYAERISESNVIEDVGICYNLSGKPKIENSKYVSSGSSDNGKYVVVLSDLTPSTKYYYCACMVRNGKYYYGQEKSFTTKSLPALIVQTTESTNITQTTATLSGNIQGYETDDFGHRYGIIYSTDTTPTASNGTIVYSNNIQEDGNYSVDVASLTENTTYYYRAFVIDGGNYVYGDVMSFTTQKENMSERDILIAFYNATDGDNWKNNENWCSEKPLNEWYGIETNDEGFVTRITIRNNNVMGDVDFKGLNYLQDLDLNSNNITSLNVEDCKGIEELNCNFNSALATLNILGCNSLKGIQVKNCNLSSLDLSSCQNLTNLACQNNKLTSLEQLSSLTTLTGLSCSYNQLTELNISGNRNLQTLSVESNQLTELDVANFTELVFLYCENNQLKRLDVSNLSNLLTLDCDKNNLEELVLPKNASLQRLYCSWNQLKYLDLSGCTILERIGCLDNKLSSLNVSNSPLLVELNCSDNVISDLNTTNCTKIQILSIAVNQIEYLDVSYMSELERLYTQGNYIKQIYLPEGFTITPEDYDRYYTFWEEDGYQYPEFNWK